MTKEWGMGFILSGIHVITGRRVRRRRKGEWQQTRQRYDKSPTLKFTHLGLVGWVTVTYFAPWEEEKNSGVQCPWGVSCFYYYPAVRTGSSNTRFFYYFPFFWWSLAPDLRFLLGQTYSSRLLPHRLLSRLLLHRLERVSWVTITSFTPRVEGGTAGWCPWGFSCFPFFWWSLAPDLRFLLGQTYSLRLLLHRLERVSWVTIISFTLRGEGERRGNAPWGFSCCEMSYEFLRTSECGSTQWPVLSGEDKKPRGKMVKGIRRSSWFACHFNLKGLCHAILVSFWKAKKCLGIDWIPKIMV